MQPYHSLTDEERAINRSALNLNQNEVFFSSEDFLTTDKQDTFCMQSIMFAGPFDSERFKNLLFTPH